MKTIIKLLIVAAILNACARGAIAAWSYYQFKDVTEQALIFGANASPAVLHEQIMRRAADLEIPVQSQDVQVMRDGARTLAQVSYTQAVELFPNYEYPFKFSFSVNALAVNAATVPDVAR